MAALAQRLGTRLLFVSSSGTVACSRRADLRPDERAPYAYEAVQHWPYYRSKIAAEQAAHELLPDAGQLVVARPPILLGPGDVLYRSTATVVRLLRGGVPFVLSGNIAFVDVRDAARTLIEALHAPMPPRVLHLPGHDMSLKAYFGTLAALAGRKPPRFALPDRLALAVAHASAAYARLRRAPHAALEPVTVEMGQHCWGLSSTEAARLGHRPRPAVDTLRDTVDDLQRRRPDCGPAPERAPAKRRANGGNGQATPS